MKRALVAVVALLLVASAAPASATDGFTFTRIAGPDRVATAAQLALAAFPGPELPTTALLAEQHAFPDALAGNFAGGVLGAPLLLTEQEALSPATVDALGRLGIHDVVLLGGTERLPEAIADAVRALGLGVTRIAGGDRYGTAAQLAAIGGSDAVGTNEHGERTAVLSSGLRFPDALTAGPIVYRQHLPQLLTGDGALPASTIQALRLLGIQHVIITGGPAAVPSTVEAELTGLGIGSVERIAGTTRVTTALAMAAKATLAFGFTADRVNVATADDFADALAGGAFAGREGSTILLLPHAQFDSSRGTFDPDFLAICDTLEFIAGTLASGHVFGGPIAVYDPRPYEECAQPLPGPGQRGRIVRVDPDGDRYTYVELGTGTVHEVTFDAGDGFRRDGETIDIDEFRSTLAVSQLVLYADDTSEVDRDVHALTRPALFSGAVTDLDRAEQRFTVVSEVTGDPLGGPYRWTQTGNSRWYIDDDGVTEDEFAAAITEGMIVVVQPDSETDGLFSVNLLTAAGR